MRLIDADKLDRVLNRIPVMGLKEDCGYSVALVSLAQVLRVIDEQPPVKLESKWTSCSKRLPETYGAYLVQDVYGGIFVDYWRGYWLAKTTMVAWRELPEPYKGGATE